MGQYTKAVGTKFNPDGTLRYFPGNTVICKCNDLQPLFSELCWAQEQYRKLPFAHKFSFLPPASFHMTVFELLCDQVRDAAHWSSIISKDMPIGEVDQVLMQAFAQVTVPTQIAMRFVAVTMNLAVILKLEPATESCAALLRQYRDALADVTGIRFPNHDKYQFHIGLAYNTQDLQTDESKVISDLNNNVTARLHTTTDTFTLTSPEFVMFNDMGDFKTNLMRSA